jgi:hypothetical protein
LEEKNMAGPTKQVVLNFEKMNKAGLMPLAKKFQRHGLEVADIEGTNKPKRESGMQIKTATFVFSTGQRLDVKVKNDGTVFQVRLNKKVVPIRHVDDMGRAIIEIVDYVQHNQKAYLKAQERRVAKAAAGDIKPVVRTTRAEQIDNYTARVAELQAEHENLVKSAGDNGGELATVQGRLAELQAELDELVQIGNVLEKEREALQEAA